MSPMLKGRGEQTPREQTPELRVRRKRRAAAATNEPFVLAFLDALRDILHDELRAAG